MMMIRTTIFLLLFFILFKSVHTLLDLDLIIGYFIEKSATDVTIFGCFTKREKITIAKKFMFSTRKISILSVEQTDFEKNLQTKYGRITVVLDASCPEIEPLLIKCGEQKFFDVKHQWLILAPSNAIFQTLNNVILNINADIHVAIPNSSNKTIKNNWNILDVYNSGSEHGGSLITFIIGNYSKENGYFGRIIKDKYWLRKNMTGVTLRSSLVLLEPFEGTLEEYLLSDKNPEKNTYNRLQNRLIDCCQKYYNFNLNLSLASDYGFANLSGYFDGMVGSLIRKEIDFGSTALWVKLDRLYLLDYGKPAWHYRGAFLFRNPKRLGSFKAFFKPLSLSIWLISLGFGVLSIIILKMVTIFEKKKLDGNTETTWSVSVLLTLGAFCQQGAPETSRMTCGRIVTIFILLLSIMIYQFYSANIVSNLLMVPPTTIKTIKDLQDSSLKIYCDDASYIKDFFRFTKDTTYLDFYYKKIHSNKTNHTNYLTKTVGLDLVAKGGYAFQIELANAYPYILRTFSEEAICELREVVMFRKQGHYSNYQRGSPFKDMMDHCFLRLAEYGIISLEIQHWHPRKPQCSSQISASSFRIGINEIYPVLIIFGVGIVASLIIMFMEIAIHKILTKRQLEKEKTNNNTRILPFID